MTSTQQRRSRAGGVDPASRGLILVGVAVLLGLIVLVKGGGVGFDRGTKAVAVPDDGAAAVTTTTAAPVTTTTVPTVSPAEVKVVVANGSGTTGLARAAAKNLAGSGYTQATATDAVGQPAATTVYFAQGYEANARSIGGQLGLDGSRVQALSPGTKLAKVQPSDAGVIVVLGPDATASSGATTTTTG